MPPRGSPTALEGAEMFAKLAVLIVAVGLSGGGLLAVRQSRLQAAHEYAASRLRARDHAEKLSRLRAQVAAKSTPEAIRSMIQALPVSVGSQLSPFGEQPAVLPRPQPIFDAETGRWIDRRDWLLGQAP